MATRTWLIGAALSVALITGGTAVATAGSNGNTPANCVGQQVSMMARDHGGMASATMHHNAMHDTDLTVGEHQAHIREMCAVVTP